MLGVASVHQTNLLIGGVPSTYWVVWNFLYGVSGQHIVTQETFIWLI